MQPVTGYIMAEGHHASDFSLAFHNPPFRSLGETKNKREVKHREAGIGASIEDD